MRTFMTMFSRKITGLNYSINCEIDLELPLLGSVDSWLGTIDTTCAKLEPNHSIGSAYRTTAHRFGFGLGSESVRSEPRQPILMM
jgi:hypothetical protein